MIPESDGGNRKGFTEETSEQRLKGGNELLRAKGYSRRNKINTHTTNVCRMQSQEQGGKYQKCGQKDEWSHVVRGAKELEFIEFVSDCVFAVQENKSQMCSSKIFTT